jgi:hypothetical protein
MNENFFYIQHAIYISVTNCIYCFLDKKVHFLVKFLSSSYLTPDRKYKIEINYDFEQAHTIYGMMPVIGYGMSI